MSFLYRPKQTKVLDFVVFDSYMLVKRMHFVAVLNQNIKKQSDP